MNLTKEKCKKALNDIKMLGSINIPTQSLSIIEQLIEEYFDNPPLKCEELENMIRKPIWDNKYKKWFLLREIAIFSSTGEYELELIDKNGNNNIDDFEENRFYRKQVEE